MSIFSIFSAYPEREYRRLQALSRWLMLAGMAWCVLLLSKGWTVGFLTAISWVYMGAIFGSYLKRSTERGLWMLAALFGVGTAAFYLLAIAMSVRDALAHASSAWWIALDATAAGWGVVVAIRASWTVLVQNRRLGRDSAEVWSRRDDLA